MRTCQIDLASPSTPRPFPLLPHPGVPGLPGIRSWGGLFLSLPTTAAAFHFLESDLLSSFQTHVACVFSLLFSFVYLGLYVS